MATQAELTTKLAGAAAKQEKTISEIVTLQGTVTSLVAEVANLQAIIAAGGTITPELEAAVDRVDTLATQADEQIPDVVPIPVP